MALITSISDPTLHATLLEKWNAANQPGWVLIGYNHYRRIFALGGEIAFLLVENRDLYDSRSPTQSRAATYTELEE
jgi:hypothetical protein